MFKLYLTGLYYTLRRAYRQNEINKTLIKQILEEIKSILDMEEGYDTTL
ncbi:hypothetical protein IJ556_03295 [bacterium]|nr:hypothetical protein [bacterium]